MKKSSITQNPASELEYPPLSEETIRSLQELGEVYRQIHRRLMSEGYIFQNGEFVKPGESDTNNGTN